MPFKKKRPELRAKSEVQFENGEHFNAATNYYHLNQSAKYTTASNAAIQTELTEHALLLMSMFDLLSDESEKSKVHTVLDIGAGSGLSTYSAAKWYQAHGLDAFIIAFDISQSMLLNTSAGELYINGIGEEYLNTKKGIVEHYRGNAAQFFPLRSAISDYVMGISMLQWLDADGIESCIHSLRRVLTSTGSCVFQFYPSSIEQVEMAERIALHVGFQYAEVFVSFPHKTPAKKWYLIISNEGLIDCQNIPLSCFFGRRFRRRCAWHIVQNSKRLSADGIRYRDRLRTAHLKQVWHIYRKLRRMSIQCCEPEVNILAVDGTSAAKQTDILNFKEGEEAIARALETYFDGCGLIKNAVTYSLIVKYADEVINLCHEVRNRFGPRGRF
ncbi:hypothetical protein ABG067_002801 [Albugo candida]